MTNTNPSTLPPSVDDSGSVGAQSHRSATPRIETIGKGYPRGSAHYNWLGDDVSERGGRTRALRAYPDIGPCSRCGAKRAERHHRDGNTANNAPDNIDALCRRCHMAADGRLEKMPAVALALLPSAVAAAASARKARTHCLRGHPLRGDNLYLTVAGSRGCKDCRTIHKAAYRGKT